MVTAKSWHTPLTLGLLATMLYWVIQLAMSSFMGAAFVPWGILAISWNPSPLESSRVLAPTDALVKSTGERLAQTGTQEHGFELEGAPELSLLFGDSGDYRTWIQHFYDLNDSMGASQTAFFEATNKALQSLSNVRKGCPTLAVASASVQASLLIERYQAMGNAFERSYEMIQLLDGLGESDALTPADKLRVRQSRGLYLRSLSSSKEMRGLYRGQLWVELKRRQCQSSGLVMAALMGIQLTPAPRMNALPERRLAALKLQGLGDENLASLVIDNSRCGDRARLVLDGIDVGRVEANQSKTFQAELGPHTLCLFSDNEAPSFCGAPGTLRSLYLYEGWSLTRHCALGLSSGTSKRAKRSWFRLDFTK